MDMNKTGVQESLGGLIQAIGQCVTAYTNFAEWAQRLLTHAEPSGHASGNRPSGTRTDFLSVRELANVLPLSPATIRQLAKQDKIPSVRAGKKMVFNLTAVLAALNRTNQLSKRSSRKSRDAQNEKSNEAKSLN